MRNTLFFIITTLMPFLAFAQPSITQNPNLGNQNQLVCPGANPFIEYTISNYGACSINWTFTNASTYNSGPVNQNKVNIVWKDTVGVGKLTATLSGCGTGSSKSLEGKTYPVQHVLLSLKGKKFDPLGYDTSPRQIDFCNPQPVYLSVSHMYVTGTGDIGQPGLIEANYEWTIPTGWKEQSTGAIGTYRTPIKAITVVPTQCAVLGNVTVKGYLGSCSTSSKSNAATFVLTGTQPIVTIAPQAGYIGSTACTNQGITFTVSASNTLNCPITGYTWETTNNNWGLSTITLNGIVQPLTKDGVFFPSGLPADNGGLVKGGITFGCGSTIRGEFPLVYKAPIPVGPGGNPVCTTASVGLVNYTGPYNNSNPVVWSSNQPGIATVNSSGLITRNGSANGAVTITANFPCSVPSVSQNIWVGFPGQPGSVTGEIAPSIGGIYQYVCSSPAQSAAYHTWTPPYYGNPVWSQSGGNASTLVPNFYVGSSSGWLQVAGVNACGNSAVSRLRIFPVAGSGGGIQRIAVHPNPASNSLTIQANSSTTTTTTFAIASTSATIAPYLFTATLVNTQNLVVKTGTSKDGKLELDLTEVPNGLYFLHVNDGIEITKSQIQVKH
jgi:hypothetical protein